MLFFFWGLLFFFLCVQLTAARQLGDEDDSAVHEP